MGRNFAFVTFSQVITQVLAFVVSVSVARDLGVDLYGLFVFGFAFPSWFLWLVSFELDTVVAVEVSADRSKAGSYLTAVTLLRIPFALVAVVILWVSVRLVITDAFAQLVTLILGAASILSTYASLYRTMFRAYERLEFAALVVVVERTIATFAILLLLVLGFGLLPIALVYVLTTIIALVLSLVILKSRFVWFTPKIEFSTMLNILKKSVPFAMEAIATTFLYSAGPLLATVLGSSAETGKFNAAFSLVLAFLAPLAVYHTVVLPSLSRLHREKPESMAKVVYKSQKLCFLVGLPVVLGGAFFSGQIITFVYGSAFAEAAQSFEILVIVIATTTLNIGLGAALAASGRQRLNLGISIAGTLTNVIVCFALIPSMGHVGAAWAFLAAEIVMVVPSRLLAGQFIGRLHMFEVVSRPLVAGAAMLFVLSALPNLSLFGGIGTGATIYFLVLMAIGGLSKEDRELIREMIQGVLLRGERTETASTDAAESSDVR